MQSNLNSISAGLQAIGIATDSWVGKLISTLETLRAIYEAIAAIKSLISIASFLFGGGAPPVPMPIEGPTGGTAPGGGLTTINNFNIGISAIDASGFRNMLNQPSHRSVLTNTINEAVRKGKI